MQNFETSFNNSPAERNKIPILNIPIPNRNPIKIFLSTSFVEKLNFCHL